MRKIIYLCGMMLLCMDMMAQDYCGYLKKYLSVSYETDLTDLLPGWRYDSIQSDEFEGSVLDRNKWTVDNYKYHGNNQCVGFIDAPDHVHLESGHLVLSMTYDADGVICTNSNNVQAICHFLSGWVRSINKMQYGYFETRCYLPKNHHYRPCFWTCGGRDASYDEIDVFEMTPNTDSPNKCLQNFYHNLGQPSISQTSQELTFSDSITGRISVYGVEVLPREIVFYVNGHVTSHLRYDVELKNDWNTFTCSDVDEARGMEVFMTFTATIVDDTSIAGIPLPREDAWFDYFRLYKLEHGELDTYHPALFIPSNESTKVYPHVVLGGSGCTANVSTNTAIWAEQDIILDKGFELSPNTSFSARVISVPDPEHSQLYIQNCNNN